MVLDLVDNLTILSVSIAIYITNLCLFLSHKDLRVVVMDFDLVNVLLTQ